MLKADNRTEVVRLRVTEVEKAFLKRLAAQEDRSVSSVLRLALREFAERHGNGETPDGRQSS